MVSRKLPLLKCPRATIKHVLRDHSSTADAASLSSNPRGLGNLTAMTLITQRSPGPDFPAYGHSYYVTLTIDHVHYISSILFTKGEELEYT